MRTGGRSILLMMVVFGLRAIAVTTDASEQPQFLSPDAAREKIRGAVDDAFFSGLRQREAAAMTGTATGDMTLADCRVFARNFFGEAILEFSVTEAEAVTALVSQLQSRFGEAYPRLVDRRWKFIKTRDDLCGGFSFTRGDCIVFSQRTVTRLSSELDEASLNGKLSLLLHEQLHVLQRDQPDLFAKLYEENFGFRRAKVNVHEWIDCRQVTNPDGNDENWYVLVKDQLDATPQPYWIGTILVGDGPVPVMGRDFSTVAVRLKQVADHYEMVTDGENVPVYREVNAFPEFTSRFPVRAGFDHPNEIAAYLIPRILLNSSNGEPIDGRAAEMLQSAKDWLEEGLRDLDEPNAKLRD